MKYWNSFIVALVVVFTTLLFGTANNGAGAAQRADEVVVTVPGQTIDGVVTLPPIAITVPIPEVPPVTIKLPAKTITVNPKPSIIRVPGPTQTVTRNIPGPTETVRIRRPAVTETVTRQIPGPTVTVSPRPVEPEPRTRTVVRYVVGTSILLLIAAGLGILALYVGYTLGWKDRDRNEKDFIGSLLPKKGKHE